MQKQRLTYLLEQLSKDVAAPSEIDELERSLEEGTNSGLFIEVLSSLMEKYPGDPADKIHFNQNGDLPGDVLALHQLLNREKEDQAKPSVHRLHFLRTTWFRYAAILLLVIGTALFFLLRPSQQTTKEVITQSYTPQPGGNKAVLILSDGSSIALDSIAEGNLTTQGNTSIIKLKTGMLAYNAGKQMPENGEILYNTIRTPRGGQYQVELPDGTRVWLNAASSITFPTFFNKERLVKLSGEAYIEVAQDKSKIFKVEANGTTIQVLGTIFNVNSYPDEPATFTTLIEGGIKVGKNGQSIILRPGEQAVATDSIALNKSIKLNQVLAWKNGLFNFQDKKLDEVMRQLARWYDLDIVYPSSVPDITFVGGISRNMQLSDMLKTLERSEVHYKIEGRNLTILP